MNTRNLIAILVVLLIIVAAIWLYMGAFANPTPPVDNTGSTATTTLPQSISDGIVTVAYNGDEFGLAVNTNQILVNSYIPPCSENFDYCFYYVGGAYNGTNFDSAGLRIDKRTDLTTEAQCLTTQPDGYSNLKPVTATSTTYATSKFSPIGDAGAGHIAVGDLYRLYTSSKCYELETRIGTTQFANYPAGTIEEFTDADKATVTGKLGALLKSVSLPSGAHPFN